MTTTSSPRSRFARLGAAALVACLALGAAACSSSDDGSASDKTATTTRDPDKGFKPTPPLPADINPVPFLKGNLVAVGNLKIKVAEVDDPDFDAKGSGTRTVTMTVEVTNGSLEPVELDPKTFLAYVANGQSDTPPSGGAFAEPLDSGETATIDMVFELPTSSELIALVFDGRTYGDRVKSALIAVDPNYKLPEADS